MKQYSEAFVGFDTAKKKHAVAIADVGREGEIRYLDQPTVPIQDCDELRWPSCLISCSQPSPSGGGRGIRNSRSPVRETTLSSAPFDR
jgi:hypothetical protein